MENIVFLTRDHPLHGGRTGFTKDISKNLKEHFNFNIISFDNKENNFQNIKIKRKFNNQILELSHFYIKSYFILKKLKKEKKLDLIIGTGLSAPGGIIFGKLNKIPTIFNTSGLRGRNINEKIRYEKSYKENKKGKTNFLSYPRFLFNFLADRLSIRLANLTTIPTFHFKDRLEKISPKLYKKIKNKLRVIIEGLNTNRLEISKKEDILRSYGITNNKIILFSRVENNLFFKELFKLVKEKIPNSTIILMESQCMKIEKNGILQKSSITAKQAMQISDLMLCIPESEPHSTSVLESLYFNCPTFVSNVGWLNYEFHNHSEFIINNLNKDEIIKKVKDFYDKKEEYYKKFKKTKDEILKRNDFKKTKDEYQNLLTNFLTKNIPS
jgi:hypothetical protein